MLIRHAATRIQIKLPRQLRLQKVPVAKLVELAARAHDMHAHDGLEFAFHFFAVLLEAESKIDVFVFTSHQILVKA